MLRQFFYKLGYMVWGGGIVGSFWWLFTTKETSFIFVPITVLSISIAVFIISFAGHVIKNW